MATFPMRRCNAMTVAGLNSPVLRSGAASDVLGTGRSRRVDWLTRAVSRGCGSWPVLTERILTLTKQTRGLARIPGLLIPPRDLGSAFWGPALSPLPGDDRRPTGCPANGARRVSPRGRHRSTRDTDAADGAHRRGAGVSPGAKSLNRGKRWSGRRCEGRGQPGCRRSRCSPTAPWS